MDTPVATAAAPSTTASTDGWEIVVGGSWFNKVGVLVFVTGLALLAGYSMMQVGPLGRVVLGHAIGAGMLALGMTLERTAAYRSYGHGLIAGGWATVYFMTFAMRALPAARVIESDLVGAAALFAVAAAMMVHSLRYRSEALTALACIVAYATLVVTPLSAFSLAASIPLAIAVMAIAQYFRWSRLALLTVAATYGVFLIRTEAMVGGVVIDWPVLAATLVVYWSLFELTDVLTIRARANGSAAANAENPPREDLFGLNAVGSFGCVIVSVPARDPSLLAGAAAVGSAIYFISALFRARLDGTPRGSQDAPATTVTTAHVAMAFSAALAMVAADLEMSGPRESFVLLLIAQFVIAAGLTLFDVPLRQIGAAAFVVAATHAMHLSGASQWRDAGASIAPVTMALLLVAVAAFANRAAVLKRHGALGAMDMLGPWIGLVAILRAIWFEVAPTWQPLAILGVAIALVVAGRERGRDLRFLGYAAALVGAAAALLPAFEGPVPAMADKVVLAAVAAMLFATHVVGSRAAAASPTTDAEHGFLAAVGLSATAATVVFNWRVVPAAAVATTLAAIGAVFFALGARRMHWPLRWQGYALVALAMVRVAVDRDAHVTPLAGSLIVIAIVFAIAIWAGRLLRAHPATPGAEYEDGLRIALMPLSTVLLSVELGRTIEADAMTPALGLQGLVTLALGFPARERVLRLSGLALLTACVGKLFLFDLRELEALPRILSFVVLGLVLLLVSWTYTRYRSAISRYL